MSGRTSARDEPRRTMRSVQNDLNPRKLYHKCKNHLEPELFKTTKSRQYSFVSFVYGGSRPYS